MIAEAVLLMFFSLCLSPAGATARDDLDLDIPSWKIIVSGLPVDTTVVSSQGLSIDVRVQPAYFGVENDGTI
jgi:hypothetical protein